MPPESRRAAREARENAARQDGARGAKTPARSATASADGTARGTTGRARKVWLIVGIVVVVLLALGAWLAFKVLIAKNSLESAQASIASVGDGGDTAALLVSLGEDAQTAAGAAADPVWRLAEFIPFAGDNLRGVRLASEALDVIANDIAVPVLDMQGDGEGGILARALPVIETGGEALRPVTEELLGLAGSSALIGPVRSGVDQVAGVLEPAQPLLDLLPDLLGADEPKNYLLVFQNNAESLPLGGSAASQTLISANAGDLEIVTQASSGSFDEKTPLEFDIPDSTAALFGSTLGMRINMSTTVPDWPFAAQMITTFWNRDIDDTAIDGVISIDPVALSKILVATGPIDVEGVTIDSDNALTTLLSDVYKWWDAYTKAGAVQSDAFFASTAAQMFEKIASGDFDLKDMAWAVTESVERGSIMAWMADADAQAVLEANGRIAGILPTSNDEATTLGVFFRDVSASKIDYYMDSAVETTMTCSDGVATLTATATLTLDLTQAEANALPRYVQSYRHGAEYFSTHVFMYAPPGMEIDSIDVDGNWVEPFRQGNVDFGRAVQPFQMRITPGETVTVTTTFTGSGDFGPLDVRTTPMVRTTDLTLSDTCG